MLRRGTIWLLAIALAGCGDRDADKGISPRQADARREAAQESAILATVREVKALQEQDAALKAEVIALRGEVERLKANAATHAELRRAIYQLREERK